MSQTRILLALAAFAAASIFLVFSDDPGDGANGKRSEPEIIPVLESDLQMNAAMERARSSVNGFADRLPRLRAAGLPVSVKLPLTENGETEHVWMGDPSYDQGLFFGYLASEPANLPSWSHGDRIVVPADEISDWMAIENGTLYGGFTMYVLRDRMTPEQRRGMEQRMGISLPDRPVLWD